LVVKKKLKFEALLLWEDKDYMAVDKPPFVSTLSDRTTSLNLLSLAKDYHSDAQACHRLDKDTSGVIVFAKNPEAYRHMSMQFEHRKVQKIYHAITDGIHNFSNQLVDAPIAKTDDGFVKVNKRDGKPAQTWFTTLKAYRTHTLVECRPVTGRMHQIRIHLSLLHAPITGDEQYGGEPFYLSRLKRGYNLKKFTDEVPLSKRMALHARTLIFSTLTGKKVSVEAPYPKDFKALIRQLDLNQ
jgi:RluA family pseudouridine synthase